MAEDFDPSSSVEPPAEVGGSTVILGTRDNGGRATISGIVSARAEASGSELVSLGRLASSGGHDGVTGVD